MLERLYLVPFVPIGTDSSQTLTLPTTFWTILSQCLPLGAQKGHFGPRNGPPKTQEMVKYGSIKGISSPYGSYCQGKTRTQVLI